MTTKHNSTHGVAVPEKSPSTWVIYPPEPGPMPSICEGMDKPSLWAYAHLCGWRSAGVAGTQGDQRG